MRPCTRSLDMDMVSIQTMLARFIPEYLVAPEQVISTPVLEPIPCMQELGDPVRPDVAGKLLCVFPGERGAQG